MRDELERRTLRPRASIATITNSIIIISTLIGGGITTIGFFADIKGDIRVLQSQVADTRQTINGLTAKLEAWQQAAKK